MANNGDFAPSLANLVQQQTVKVSSAVTGGIVDVQKDGTTVDASVRSKINFVTGTNTTLTVTDNSGSDRVDVTIDAVVGVTGRVAANGTKLAGTGFSVVHSGTGIYTVTFTTAFSAVPLILLAVNPTGDGNMIGFTSATTSSFVVQIDDKSGTPVDHIFDFWAHEIV